MLPVSFIKVTHVRTLTPRMVRITFTGDGLDGFDTWPDQQVKLCFPRPGQSVPMLPAADEDTMRWYQAYLAMSEDERPWLRSFTIRAHDPARRTVDIDFVLHGDAGGPGGPAARWGRSAAPGDVLGMVGPGREYTQPLAEADWYLFAGDDTALPAIGTLMEALPVGTRAVAYLEVDGAGDEQAIGSAADVTVHWVHRDGVPPGRSTALVDAVRAADLPAGAGFAWLAGEAGAVRALRRHLLGERGVHRTSVEFSGYWRHTLSQDDAPTDEDLAEVRERLAAQ